MNIDEMKKQQKLLGYTDHQLSVRSGVSIGNIRRILEGDTSRADYRDLLSLVHVLKEPEAHEDSLCEAEAADAPKQQGEFTLNDYYDLPEDGPRMELIDGTFYKVSSAASIHQLIGGFIHAKFLSHILTEKGDCLPIIAPMDVQLDCDEKTMVQPDVLILCDRDKLMDRCVYGAPDFVLEVLSKSSRRKDTVIKLNKYLNAGVQEYWIVDPYKQKTLVYDFNRENYPVFYGFDAKIPVSIWNDGFAIDFQEIYEHTRFLYERSQTAAPLQ